MGLHPACPLGRAGATWALAGPGGKVGGLGVWFLSGRRLRLRQFVVPMAVPRQAEIKAEPPRSGQNF